MQALVHTCSTRHEQSYTGSFLQLSDQSIMRQKCCALNHANIIQEFQNGVKYDLGDFECGIGAGGLESIS